MTAARILVPWRDKGDPWRQANLAVVLTHLSRLDVAPVEVVSDGREGCAPFNRSAAYNRGAALCDPGEVMVFHEADMLLPRAQLLDAIALAGEAPGMVVPFDTYRYLSRDETIRVRQGADPIASPAEHVMADGRSNGAVNVISRVTLDAVGRWDEEFSGWGFDDRAMAHAFHVATGVRTRYIPGPGTHLWHVPGWSESSRFRGGARIDPAEQVATEINEHRFHRYRDAHTPEKIRALTAGG